MIFCHHGDYGDVVYSLMAAKYLADEAATPCTFYLSPANDTREKMTAEHAEGLLPLIRAQSYVARAEWRAHALGIRIDRGQRKFWQAGYNIADQHAHYLGIPCSAELPGPWLVAEPNPLAAVVFARSQRYRNPNFPWKYVQRRFGAHAVFVGTQAEHQDFLQHVGPVPIVPTPTLLDVARVIAGCKLFCGNQSSPRAIAEGLKVPCVVEAHMHHLPYQGTHFARPDAWYNTLPPATFAL